MRVLILSQYYDPEPVPKPGELARALREGGHEVFAITGFPNYPTGVLYPGYRLGFLERQIIDEIPVSRTYEYPYHGRSAIRRLLNYWSFAFSAPWASLFMKRADVMYVWHPPLTVGVAAWLISRLRGIPFVYDVQDIWPESAVLSGMMREGFLVGLMYRLERWIYARAAHILVVTEGARGNLIGKGVHPEKISVMPHWIDDKMFGDLEDDRRQRVRDEFGWSGDFIALFAGNLGKVQGLDTVVRAATLLAPHSRVRIVLMGEGADNERLIAIANECGAGHRVQFVGRQNVERMPEIMGSADALLVHLRRSELSRYVIPTKTLSYLAAARPIVMAMEGAAADLVAEAQAGVIIPPDEPQLLADALEVLSTMPADERSAFGRRGRAYLRRNLTKERVLGLYEEVLARVAETG